MTLQTDAPLEHRSLGATNRPADFFVRVVRGGDMTLDAPYQRGAVWTDAQRVGLVKSWLLGITVPAIILNDRGTPDWRRNYPSHGDDLGPLYAVIDGKQRILAAIAWLTGDLLVPASWFPAEHVEATEGTADGPYVRYSGLTRVGQRFAESRASFPCAEARVPTIEQEAEIYGLINSAGTVQTDDDLARAAQVAAGGRP
jgi:hypothetical protein